MLWGRGPPNPSCLLLTFLLIMMSHKEIEYPGELTDTTRKSGRVG
jgi:hypothetical protein